MRLKLTSILLAATSVTLTGCGTNIITPTAVTFSSRGLAGSVYGGRQPIAYATISLYQTGTTGYGAGASMPTPPVTTSSTGIFSFPAFTCTAGTQIYIVSTGGDPYGNGENNVAATLLEGLGSCTNIANVSKVLINEVTTVSSVWALAPFMTGTNIGAPTTNQTGLANAFLDIATLVNISNGSSPGPNVSAGTSVPTAEINTLADALVSCVNSIDNSTTTSTACTNLFGYATPSGGPAPTDTVGAAINIARNPGANVLAIIAAGGSTQAFQPTITTANDLTIGITYTGSGITAPSAMEADASGNIWIANSTTNSVTELAHNGTTLSGASGYMAGALSTPAGIAIDTSGNAWIANSGNSTLTELTSTGANASGSPFMGGGLSSPSSVAIDGLGNIFLSNVGTNSISVFNSSGTAISGASGYAATGLAAPVGLSINPR